MKMLCGHRRAEWNLRYRTPARTRPERAARLLGAAMGTIDAAGPHLSRINRADYEHALAIARRGYILVDGRNSKSGPAADLARDPDVRRIFLGG